MTELGDRLRALMGSKGVSVAQLASAGGIDASAMQAILAGGIQRPPDRRLRGFAELLGTSFDALLRLIPKEKREAASALYDRASCAVIVAGVAPDWIQLMPLGEVRTRDTDSRAGWVLKDPAAVIEASKAGLDKLPIDYDHQTDYAQTSGNTARAAGWIEELQVRDDGIYARVEWTEKGAAAIAAREYRFISPVFLSNKKTGEITRILRAGLTNDPALFVKALASAQANEEDDMEKLLKQLRQLLGLAEDADETAVCAAVKDVADRHATAVATVDLAKALGLAEDADHKTICAAAKKVAAKAKSKGDDTALAGVAKALGLDKDASAEEVETAAAKATATAAQAGDRDELAARLAKLEDDGATEKATTAVDGAIKAGKLTPAQRDWAVERAKKDPKDFETFLASQPVIVKPGGGGGGKPPKGGEGLTEDELALCKRHGLKPEDYKKTRDEEREEEIV